MAVRVDDLREFLSCPVCFEAYDRHARVPKILPCMHTFCVVCLESLHKAQPGPTLQCPFCKRATPTPAEGVRGIPSNFGYVDLIEMVKSRSSAADAVLQNQRSRQNSNLNVDLKSANGSDLTVQQLSVLLQHLGSSAPNIFSSPRHQQPTDTARQPSSDLNGSFELGPTNHNSASALADTDDEDTSAGTKAGGAANAAPLASQHVTLCDECDEDENAAALHFCLVCARPLCEFHRKNHERSKQTKQHTLVPLSTPGRGDAAGMNNEALIAAAASLLEAANGQSNTVKTDSDLMVATSLQLKPCSEHADESLTLFCQQCHQAICRQCVLPAHANHPLHTVQTVFLQQRKQLKLRYHQLRAHAAVQTQSNSHNEQLQAAIESRSAELGTRIDECMSAIRAHLDTREASLRAQLKAATDLKVAALRSQSAQQSEEQRVLMQLLGDTESLLALVSQSPPNIDPIQEADRADMALDVFLLSKQAELGQRMESFLQSASGQHRGSASSTSFDTRNDLALRIEAPTEEVLSRIDSLGEVWEDSCSALTSLASGEGLRCVRRGQRTSLLVQTRDSAGRELGVSGSGEVLEVSVTSSDNESSKQPLINVTDRGDGTYEVMYMLPCLPIEESRMQGPLLPVSLGGCPVIGECEVSVRLRGCELSGAPFRLPLLDSATPPSCQGIFQRAFGSSGQGDGQLSNARGLAADHANQLLYVADYNNNRICVFRMSDGRFVRKFGRQGNGAGELSYCWSVVLDPLTGQLYVSDCGNHRICVFRAADGAFLRSFGSPGSGEGQLRFPEGLALDVANDLLFVCDYSNHRISVFRASDGLFVRTFGGQPRLQTPVGIAFGLNGDVYVTQYELHRVAVFNSFDGRFLRHFPSDSEAAPVANAETLSNPYGVVVDGEGNVLIGDYANKRVAMFRGDGTFVRAIGGDGGAKLEGPQGLALDDDGRLWITDITTGRIHMYS